MGFLNTHIRFHANLNCDKLRISYADYNFISLFCTAHQMSKYFWKAWTVSVSVKKKMVWPWRKSHWSLCKASPCLCCMVLLQWWEELDLSQITQPPSGLPVHCCQLRRGRLWIAEVVPAFYQNYSKFRAVFPKHNMKSVSCWYCCSTIMNGANRSTALLMKW